MQRGLRTLGLLAAVVTMSACGADGGNRSGDTKPEASTTKAASASDTLPEEGAISAGKYETGVFEPAFSLRVDNEWQVFQRPDLVALFKEKEDLALSFARIEVVFDPSKPTEEVSRPAPRSVDGWITWFQKHPNLDTGKPVPVTVGGVSGMRIDSVVSSIPSDYPEECPVPCVPAMSTGEKEGVFDFISGYKDRTIVLNVEGEIVLGGVSSPEEEFTELGPKAEEVLDTVEWEAAS